jgi:DNA-binding IclR family transcriptional regulator
VKSRKAVELGYVQQPSDFVDGVTDMCMPIMGNQGATACLIVPFISIKSQSVTPEKVLERLRIAVEKISAELVD